MARSSSIEPPSRVADPEPPWGLVDPELLDAARNLPSFDIDEGSVAAARTAMASQLAADPPPQGDSVTVRRLSIEASPGDFPVGLLVYEPAKGRRRTGTVLDIHGGGFVMGAALMNDAQNRRLAAELDVVVVSVDYRLAPDFPFPQPLDDCHAAASWIAGQSDALDVPAGALVILGTSAGGALAAGLALRLRDMGLPGAGPGPRGLVLLSPMLDDRTGVGEAGAFTGWIGWSPRNNAFGWHSLLGRAPGSDDVSCHAAPARAASLEGLPSTFISVGSLDLFVAEDLEFARRLSWSGVSVELLLYPGAFHGFARFAPEAAVSRRSASDMSAAVRRMLRAKTKV